ncbi:C5a anaphylatoxin chemotactic receptor 1 [Stigmatopora nigra]
MSLSDMDDDYDWNLNYTFPDSFFNFTEFTDIERPKIQPIQIMALTFYALVVLLGVPGNAIVMWVAGFKMATSVTTIWFINLALTDFLCCLSLPLLMVPLAHDDHWHFGPLGCTLFKGFFYWVMYCSVLQLVLISLDRWLLVAKPVWCHNNRRPKIAVLGCVVVWSLALIGSMPQFIYAQEIELGELKRECMLLLPKNTAWLLTEMRLVFGFILPFLVIVICHWRVYRRAESGITDKGRRSMRTLKVIIAVVLSFFVCWLPLHIMDFLTLVTPRTSPNSPSVYLAYVLTLCLAYFNSCLNPLLYVCVGRGFKNTMNRSLCNVLHLLGEDPTSRKMTARETKAASSSEKAMTNV